MPKAPNHTLIALRDTIHAAKEKVLAASQETRRLTAERDALNEKIKEATSIEQQADQELLVAERALLRTEPLTPAQIQLLIDAKIGEEQNLHKEVAHSDYTDRGKTFERLMALGYATRGSMRSYASNSGPRVKKSTTMYATQVVLTEDGKAYVEALLAAKTAPIKPAT